MHVFPMEMAVVIYLYIIFLVLPSLPFFLCSDIIENWKHYILKYFITIVYFPLILFCWWFWLCFFLIEKLFLGDIWMGKKDYQWVNECHLRVKGLVEGKTDDPIISKWTTFCSEKVLTELNRDDQKNERRVHIGYFQLVYSTLYFWIYGNLW